jgi:diguanylate cyclase (GGDEF)-like protein
MSPCRQLCVGLLLLSGLLAEPVQGVSIPGAPLLRHYGVEDTKTTPGHWAVTTDSDGALLVGNNEGVLRFDGVDWQLTPLPGRSPARALATGSDGLIYVGGYDTFGRLAKSRDGGFIYEELLTRANLRGGARHVGIVWDAMPTSGGIYFHSERALFLVPYGDGDVQSWKLPEGLRSFYVADDRLYARIEGVGFVRFENGKARPEPGAEAFAHQPLPGLIDQGDWLLLVGRDGLFRADADGIRRLPGEAGTLLAGRRSYTVQLLEDGSFAVGTLDGELLRIDREMRLRERVDLGGFGIQDLGLDREGGLWAATEGDLVRLSLPSPWSFLGEAQGLSGSPTDFEWYDGALWLASTSGLARMTPGGDGPAKVESLPWTELEANALHASDAGLLIGVREGLLVLDAGATQPRSLYESDLEGVFWLVASRHDPAWVYGMTSGSVLLLHEVDGRWQLQAKIPLDGVSVSGMVEAAAGELWFGDSRGPVQRWNLDLTTGQVLEHRTYADADGLAVVAGSGTSVFRLDERVHAYSDNRGFVLDGDRFVPDAAPPFTLVGRPHELQVEETALGDYAYTSRELWYRPADGGEWQVLYPGTQGAIGYTWLRVSRDGVLRIATWSGLLQFDPEEHSSTPQPLRLEMESVHARSPDGEVVRLSPRSGPQPVKVPPGHSMNLRFGMVSMESGAEFRYLLHGITPDWSSWTDRDLFIRALPPGDYVLEVEARTRNGRQAAAMNYTFQVERRWYEQWWVIGCGIVALAALLTAFTLWLVRLRTERYLEANRRLEARIAERTRELEDLNRQLAELVTEDALTGVANRRALENGLRREWLRCLDQRRPLSVLMIDVDHFKAYNDAHGHLEGDVQLKGIAQRLHSQHDPQRELLARYGGEEFALLLPGVHREEALRRAEKVREVIATSDAGMTVSIGVAGFVPEVQKEPDTLLRRADAALYMAKRAGRNRVEIDPG